MEVIKVEAVSFRDTSSSGVQYSAGETVEIVGQKEIGMLGTPNAEKYLCLKTYTGGDDDPKVLLSVDGQWKESTEDEADKAITAFRKQETARLKREARNAEEAARRETARQVALAGELPSDNPEVEAEVQAEVKAEEQPQAKEKSKK